MNRHKYREIILAEFSDAIDCGFNLWRRIPCAATAAVIALLDDATLRTRALAYQRDAVEDTIRIALAGEDRKPAQDAPALRQWRELRSAAWRYLDGVHEWDFKGFAEQKALAMQLLRLRRGSARRGPSAETLVRHYAHISDETLENAQQRRAFSPSAVYEAIFNAEWPVRARQQPSARGTRHLALADNGLELRIEMECRNNTFTYGVVGFFDNPHARATYERQFAIGLGDWDRIDSGAEADAGVSFALLVTKYWQWKTLVADTTRSPA
jgi:hypothetical protein